MFARSFPKTFPPLLLLVYSVFTTGLPGQGIWPVGSDPFLTRTPLEERLQPTASGNRESALFGCVRNDGTRFHEGIDLGSLEKNAKGVPVDKIRAAFDGTVVHINRVAGDSSYGRYVVLEHAMGDLHPYTLYAHLARIDKDIAIGQEIRAGHTLGIIGWSAGGYRIPRSRAHLHFEIGFRLGKHFEAWYRTQGWETPNQHGLFNGMNLVGLDPLDYWQETEHGPFPDLHTYLLSQEPVLWLRVGYPGLPDFLSMNPSLMRSTPNENNSGWDIGFTGYGLPVRWSPIEDPNLPYGRVSLLEFREDGGLMACRGFIYDPQKAAMPSSVERTLQLLFGFTQDAKKRRK